MSNPSASKSKLLSPGFDILSKLINLLFSGEITRLIAISEFAGPITSGFSFPEELGVSNYINLPGGKDFFDKSKYKKNGIELDFLSINLKEYNQNRQCFEQGLSIIDAMMFNSPLEIVQMINDVKYI